VLHSLVFTQALDGLSLVFPSLFTVCTTERNHPSVPETMIPPGALMRIWLNGLLVSASYAKGEPVLRGQCPSLFQLWVGPPGPPPGKMRSETLPLVEPFSFPQPLIQPPIPENPLAPPLPPFPMSTVVTYPPPPTPGHRSQLRHSGIPGFNLPPPPVI